MKPLLTVGVPVYNGMSSLKETMESLFAQTFQDFKILVINDGSKDDSLEYLRSIKDPRMTLISQENRGLTDTLNRMLAEIDTPWLVRQDADDISFPHRMGVLHDWATRNPDAGLLYSRASHYQDGRLLLELQTTGASPEHLRHLTQVGHLLSICHTTVALNVSKIKEVGGYRFNYYIEDYDMYWRMALATDLVYIPQILVGARTGSRGVSGTNIGRQGLNMLWVQYLLMSKILDLTPFDYPEAIKRLEPLLTPRLVSYRFEMRRCLDCIGERRNVAGLVHLVRAAIASPELFIRRISRFARPPKNVVLGIDPKAFIKRKNELWSSASSE